MRRCALIDSETYTEAIARVTKDFDLLIMGHHPRSRILAFLKGSTDERVAEVAEQEVLEMAREAGTEIFFVLNKVEDSVAEAMSRNLSGP